MIKSLLFSSKVFAFALLLSSISHAMENNVPATNVPVAQPTPAAQCCPPLATVAVAQPALAIEPIVRPTPVVQPVVNPAPVVASAAKSSSFLNIKENWAALTTAISNKKGQVSCYASGLKQRGWTGLSRNEKVAFVAAGAVAVAAVTYGVYKLYQSYTKADKNTKDLIRRNRN